FGISRWTRPSTRRRARSSTRANNTSWCSQPARSSPARSTATAFGSSRSTVSSSRHPATPERRRRRARARATSNLGSSGRRLRRNARRGNQPPELHELPAIFGRDVFDRRRVGQVARREAVDAPLLELHHVPQLVRPELRIVAGFVLIREYHDVVERDGLRVLEQERVLL